MSKEHDSPAAFVLIGSDCPDMCASRLIWEGGLSSQVTWTALATKV
jgi:hypothetical protein